MRKYDLHPPPKLLIKISTTNGFCSPDACFFVNPNTIKNFQILIGFLIVPIKSTFSTPTPSSLCKIPKVEKFHVNYPTVAHPQPPSHFRVKTRGLFNPLPSTIFSFFTCLPFFLVCFLDACRATL